MIVLIMIMIMIVVVITSVLLYSVRGRRKLTFKQPLTD